MEFIICYPFMIPQRLRNAPSLIAHTPHMMLRQIQNFRAPTTQGRQVCLLRVIGFDLPAPASTPLRH